MLKQTFWLGLAVNRFYKKTHCYTPAVAKCQFLTDILINNAYMNYLELRLMQFKVENEFTLNEFQQARVKINLVNCQVNVVKDMSNQLKKQP